MIETLVWYLMAAVTAYLLVNMVVKDVAKVVAWRKRKGPRP